MHSIVPFYWCRNHYRYHPSNFLFQYGRLTKQEVANYDKLWAYVRKLTPCTIVDKNGNVIHNGNLCTQEHHINTHALLKSSNLKGLLGKFCSTFVFALDCLWLNNSFQIVCLQVPWKIYKKILKG